MSDFFEEETSQPNTTAIYPTRIADKTQVESTIGLHEFGNVDTKFYTSLGKLFAIGYVRIVYGDHGPYTEFQRENIQIQLKSKFDTSLPKHCFYEWLVPTDGSELKVYDQKRAVRSLAPQSSRRWISRESPGRIVVNSFMFYCKQLKRLVKHEGL